MRPALVVVVGDVMNDVVVRPLGPIADGTDTPSAIEATPGGSGSNQAAWLAALGTPVRFVGRGGAPDAERHTESLARLGVDVRLAADPKVGTGTVVALVSADGERTMFTDRAANLGLRREDVPEGVLDGAGLLHVSAYQLFEPGSRSAVTGLWAEALRAGIATSVDPASLDGLRRVGREAFLRWTAGASIAFPNLDEGRFLSDRDDPQEIAAVLVESYPLVALKLGRAGVLLATAEGDRVGLPAAGGPVVDSTGAGDAFCAGFLSRWVRGAALPECAATALETAARALGRVGARPPDDAGDVASA